MNTIELKERWIRNLLPEGFPYPTSTLISGPGRTGKPLIELAFVASWLKCGGSVVGIPLQYPSMEFVKTTMDKLYNLDLKNYSENVAFIQFDPHIDKYEYLGNNILRANLLKSEIWNNAIKITDNMVKKSDLGTMIFGSALNLLLFSPTYRKSIIKNLEGIIKRDKSRAYVFSVSTSAFADEIKVWEEAADNLMYTKMEKPMQLSFEISKMREVRFSKERINVPIPKETLIEIKNIAEATRKRIIPEIMEI